MMVTECSMSDNVQVENPKVEFIKPCNLCPYMKTITLPKILDCLEKESNEIIIPNNLIKKARAVCRKNDFSRSLIIKSDKYSKTSYCQEDLKPSGDVTTKLIKNNKKIKAKIIAQIKTVLIGGLNYAKESF